MQKQNTNLTSDTMDSFLNHLSLSKSEKTVKSYRYDLGQFETWLAGLKMRNLGSLKSEHVMSYLGHQKAAGKSDTTINRYYMSLRSYIRHLKRTRVLKEDITEDIRFDTPQKHQLAPRVPTADEILSILQQPDTNTEAGARDRAILEVLYSSGLRAAELCDLELRDWKGSTVLVQCGKGSKTRTVPLTPEAEQWISLYVERYRGRDEGYLFVTFVQKRRIREQYLCGMVGSYAKQARLEGVTTHTLRHACATHLLDQGADIRFIQKVLGHANIATTEKYTHLSSQSIQKMFTQFHPRGKNENLSD
jgi:integrase/recombinase XerD